VTDRVGGAARLAWLLWGLCVVLTAVALTLFVINGDARPADSYGSLDAVVWAVAVDGAAYGAGTLLDPGELHFFPTVLNPSPATSTAVAAVGDVAAPALGLGLLAGMVVREIVQPAHLTLWLRGSR
jgi:hypothetical protein